MKGIVITTDNRMTVQDFGEPLHKTVGKAVGGGIEHVKPIGLSSPYCMIVNDEGLLLGLPYNIVGSALYGTHNHGCPIVGNIVLMKDGYRNGERDIVGLDDIDIQLMALDIETMTCGMIMLEGES